MSLIEAHALALVCVEELAVGTGNRFHGSILLTSTLLTADAALVVGVNYSMTVVVGVDDARLYVNGKETGTADTGMALPATATTISVGQDYNAANQSFGSIDNLQLYNKQFMDHEVAQ